MKRRDFLVSSVLLTSSIAPVLGKAAATPCPPPTLDLLGGDSVRTTCGNGNGAPGWFVSMAEGTWATPVTNWLGAGGVKDPLADSTNRGQTGHSALITSWTGMGADQTRNTIFMLHNGGHNDYYGNEVYGCDLSQTAPAWVRRRNAYPSVPGGTLTQFAPGEPVSDHTACATVGAEGRWFSCGMASTNYNGGGNANAWWEYRFAQNDYTSISIPGGVYGPRDAVNIGACFDPIARELIVTPSDNTSNKGAQFIALDTLTTTGTIDFWLSISTMAMCVVDTTHHILLILGGGKYWFADLDKKSAGIFAVGATGPAPSDKNQIHWHPASNAFLTWGGGSTIKKLTPTVGGNGYLSLQWSDVGAAGVVPPAAGQGAGMYNKIQMINDMGDGQSALIVVPQYAFPDVFAYKIAARGV